VSIITDARNYKRIHVFYDSNVEDMCVGITKDICWNKNILGCIFKTFCKGMLSLQASALPQDFGNNDSKKDILGPCASYVMPDSEVDFPIWPSESNDLCMDFYNMVLKWSIKLSTSSLPIVRTSFQTVKICEGIPTSKWKKITENMLSKAKANRTLASYYKDHKDEYKHMSY